jgi:type II secretory pathway pseudopilin PulG
MKVRRDESGMTMVEILVGIILVAAAALATLQVFDASTRNAYRAEQSQVAVNIAQHELEEIRQLAYADVALTATPAYSADANDPRHRVSGSNFALGRDGSNQGEMAVRGVGGVTTGVINPGPTPFTSGDVSGQIYRFVVWRDDPNCLLVICLPGGHDYKRVIVAVKLDDVAVTSERSYQEMQSDFIDPERTLLSGTGGGGGTLLTAQQFFLTDTPCNNTSRQPITGDHAHHDTLGHCGNSQKPDGLYTTAPPDPDPDDPANPALYDYATDIEPGGTPSPTDKGLQLARPGSNGCNFNGGGQQQYIHRWVTQPMPLAFVASGQATLELYTRTINDVHIQGEVCIFLFVRTDPALPILPPVDVALIDLEHPPNAYFSYSENPWPRLQWTRRRISMSFAPTTLIAGQRLGIGLAVRRDGTPQDAIQFLYDHPDYAARLEVRTTTPLN